MINGRVCLIKSLLTSPFCNAVAGKSAIRSRSNLGLARPNFFPFRNETQNWVSFDSLDSQQSMKPKQLIQAGMKTKIGSR